jgi:hypothetical protein
MKSIILIVTSFLTVTAAFTQWSNDPSINTRVTTGGLLPQIISDGNGGAYIVYQDSPALLRQLWVQRLDRYGYVRFPNNGIRISSADRNQTPTYFLVSDSVGGVIVVFHDFKPIGNNTIEAVYAQRLDSSGVKLWGDAGVEISPPTDDKSPVSACSDGEGGVFVFWGENFHNRVSDLRVQRISASGKLVWPGNGILITDEFTSLSAPIPASAISDAKKGAIVLYSDSTGTRLQRIDQRGRFLWQDGIKIFPVGRQMIEDGQGGAIIAGVRTVSDSTGYHFTVGAQRVNSDGQVPWGNNGVVLTELADDLTRSVEFVLDKDKNSIFFWHDKRTGDFNIYAQKLNSEGEPEWVENGIQVSGFESTKTIFFSGIAPALPSGAIIIWSDRRIGEGGLFFTDGLFGQPLDSDGNRLWGDDDIAISTRNVRHNTHKIIPDCAGGAIVCWYEIGAGSGWGIFAQQVSRNGNLGEILTTSVSEPENFGVPNQYILHQSYPNPFNSSMIIQYQIPTHSFVQMKIFDTSGKEVIKLVNKEQALGKYTVRWNGKDENGGDLTSGLYFYQLQAGSFIKTKKALFMK